MAKTTPAMKHPLCRTHSLDLLADIHEALGDVLRSHARLEEEVEDLREYRQKYMDLLDADIAHGQHMMGGLLELALTPGVLDAVGKANASPTVEESP